MNVHIFGRYSSKVLKQFTKISTKSLCEGQKSSDFKTLIWKWCLQCHMRASLASYHILFIYLFIYLFHLSAFMVLITKKKKYVYKICFSFSSRRVLSSYPTTLFIKMFWKVVDNCSCIISSNISPLSV